LGVIDQLVLSDAAWERIAPPIIGRPDQKGSTRCDNRMFVEGVLCIVRTGDPCRDRRLEQHASTVSGRAILSCPCLELFSMSAVKTCSTKSDACKCHVQHAGADISGREADQHHLEATPPLRQCELRPRLDHDALSGHTIENHSSGAHSGAP
jgi:hypothetical protein